MKLPRRNFLASGSRRCRAPGRLALRLGADLSPEPAVPAYRRLRMHRKRPQVLGVDLNRSESTRQPACPRLSLPLLALRERRHCVIARRGIAVRRRARYAAGGGGGGFGGLGGGGLGGLGGNMATRKVK